MTSPQLFLLIVLLLCIVFGPIVTIWALNVLFPILAIPYTFQTWFAVIVVGGVFKGTTSTSNK